MNKAVTNDDGPGSSELWSEGVQPFSPRSADAQPEGAHPGDAKASALQTLQRRYRGVRVLVVDDDEVNRIIAEELLADAGLRVDLAEDGAQALSAASSTPFEVIVMDLEMPVLDGFAATRAIRRLAGHATTKIVALTASSFDDGRRLAAEAGMDEYLTKPVVPDELYATILRCLDARA
jgi:two-component system sensor histidine kinase/response regulator